MAVASRLQSTHPPCSRPRVRAPGCFLQQCQLCIQARSLYPAQVSFLRLSPGLNSKGPAGYGTPAPSSCCPQQHGSWWGGPCEPLGGRGRLPADPTSELGRRGDPDHSHPVYVYRGPGKARQDTHTLMLAITLQEAELPSVAGVLAGGGMWGQWSLRTRQPQRQRLLADLPTRGMGAAARCQWNGDRTCSHRLFPNQLAWWDGGAGAPRKL